MIIFCFCYIIGDVIRDIIKSIKNFRKVTNRKQLLKARYEDPKLKQLKAILEGSEEDNELKQILSYYTTKEE